MSDEKIERGRCDTDGRVKTKFPAENGTGEWPARLREGRATFRRWPLPMLTFSPAARQ